MADIHRPDMGDIVAMQKTDLNGVLAHLEKGGYQSVGPCIRNGTLVYGPLNSLQDLPHGFLTEQAAGRFRLIKRRHARHFDFIPGAHSWKQFLFPPRLDLFQLRKNGKGWQQVSTEPPETAYAFVGVRACELAAMQIQDRAFLREDYIDPVYRSRRTKAFIIAVNCLHPVGTCFCSSLGTGPRVAAGFDLCITELDDTFLVTIGSELGRSILDGIPSEAANAFQLNNAERAMQDAAHQMEPVLDSASWPQLILANLDHPHWDDVAGRCLSCASCTQVCPTCFCWDAVDHTTLTGAETHRERVWDSCFNPGYSSQSGGNIRPATKARYRQWLSHKFGTWLQQYGTSGCVGCGRCITWCPAEIDVRKEIAGLQKEADR